MDILKLAAIFAAIVIVQRLKGPLYVSILAATALTPLLFGMEVGVFFHTLLRSAISYTTLSVLLIFYLVTFLQRMLEARGNLLLAQRSLDRFFNNRRLTASFAPFFLGLLPSAGVMNICGQVVDQSVGDDLSREEKAFITSYFRHIPESFLPTFSSIIIPIALTEGIVTIPSFIVVMLPMVVLMAAVGYVFSLRKIRKTVGDPPADVNRKRELARFFSGIWPIVLIIVLILILDIPIYIAIGLSILLFIFAGGFKGRELVGFLPKAFEKSLLFSTFCIMLFKDTLNATGIIAELPAIFSGLPLPDILIFAIIFFVGTIISGSQAIAALGIPLVFHAIAGAGMPHFVLLMGIAFAANQLTPTHICLAVAAEYFNIPFSALVKKSALPILAVCGLLFFYYFILLGIFPG